MSTLSLAPAFIPAARPARSTVRLTRRGRLVVFLMSLLVVARPPPSCWPAAPSAPTRPASRLPPRSSRSRPATPCGGSPARSPPTATSGRCHDRDRAAQRPRVRRPRGRPEAPRPRRLGLTRRPPSAASTPAGGPRGRRGAGLRARPSAHCWSTRSGRVSPRDARERCVSARELHDLRRAVSRRRRPRVLHRLCRGVVQRAPEWVVSDVQTLFSGRQSHARTPRPRARRRRPPAPGGVHGRPEPSQDPRPDDLLGRRRRPLSRRRRRRRVRRTSSGGGRLSRPRWRTRARRRVSRTVA